MVLIPPFLKLKVLRLWLDGIPRDMIASSVGIGTGSVSRIIQDFKLGGDLPDLDLCRQLGKTLKENSLNINEFTRAIRLSEYLSNMGISEDQIEHFIDQAAAHCYDHGIDIKKFMHTVFAICKATSVSGISIQDLYDIIQSKRLDMRNIGVEKT